MKAKLIKSIPNYSKHWISVGDITNIRFVNGRLQWEINHDGRKVFDYGGIVDLSYFEIICDDLFNIY